MAATLGDDMEGAVIQPMVSGGIETIAGFVQNAEFGPQVIFGLGGTAVELLGDVVTRLAPLTDVDARDMVLGLRALRLSCWAIGAASPSTPTRWSISSCASGDWPRISLRSPRWTATR